MQHTLILIFGVLLNFCCFGQQEISYLKKITLEDGLSQSVNEFLYQDKEGYLWIGSLEGVNLFDGKSISVFKAGREDSLSFKGGNVQGSFFEDEAGDIWFTTNEAINCFKKKEGRFIHTSVDGRSNSTHHYAFYIEKERFIWLSAKNNLYRYDSYIQQDSVISPIFSGLPTVRAGVATDDFGNVSTVFSTLWEPNSGFETLSLSDSYDVIENKKWFNEIGNPANFTLTPFQIIGEQNAAAWILAKEGLLFFNAAAPTDFNFFKYPDSTLVIHSISSISERYFSVLLSNNKLTFFDKKAGIFGDKIMAFYDLDTKLPIENINLIFPSHDSILLFNSKGVGIYFGNIKNNGLQNIFNQFNLAAHSINHLSKNLDGEILGTSNEMLSWVFDEHKNLLKTDSSEANFKRVIDKQGIEWSVSSKGFSRNQDLLKLEDSDFYDILLLNQQYLAIGSNQGLIFYDKKANSFIKSICKEFAVKLFFDNQHRIWVANASNSLGAWKLKINDSLNVERITSFPNFGLIHDIQQDTLRNLIWVATSKGLVKIDNDHLTDEIITENDGLPNQFIYAILFDSKNNLWLSTNKGIVKYMPEAHQFKQYTARDGLSSNEYMPGSALLADDGKMWFGSTKGVDVFHPDSIRTIGKAPKLAINSLKIHDKEWRGELAISHLHHLELPPQKNTLKFELAALEYTDPLRNRFKVWLNHGGNSDTSFLYNENTITYANLAPGEYQLNFTACNAEGIWQQKPHQLHIEILPYFYQTWWFRILVVLFSMALVGLISALYYRSQLKEKQLELEKQGRKAEVERLNLEQKIYMEQERTRIAGEMHDEIGSGLSTIRNSTAKATRKNNVDDMKQIVTRVSQISIGLINNMRGIIWAMDSDYDSLEDLGAYLRRYVREYLEDNGLEVEMSIPFELPDRMVNGQTRHNIILVVKEALHNIVKHAKATKVRFELSINGELIIVIKDNGKGFERDTLTRRGHGLKSMENRVKNLEGSIVWEQNKPQGTVVIVKIEINE